MDWQPIETAPRKGDSVLVHVQSAVVGSLQYVAWSWGDGWTVWGDFDSEKRLPQEPTHWMPLPAPPSQEQKHD